MRESLTSSGVCLAPFAAISAYDTAHVSDLFPRLGCAIVDLLLAVAMAGRGMQEKFALEARSGVFAQRSRGVAQSSDTRQFES